MTMELEENAFLGSNRQARVRQNHKALAKGQELRQAIKIVAGRDAEGTTPSEETYDAEPTSL